VRQARSDAVAGDRKLARPAAEPRDAPVEEARRLFHHDPTARFEAEARVRPLPAVAAEQVAP